MDNISKCASMHDKTDAKLHSIKAMKGSGTQFEDLVFIDSETGFSKIRNDYNRKGEVLASKEMQKMVRNAKEYSIIAIHNHSHNNLPSANDLLNARDYKYRYGLILCHNSVIYKYAVARDADVANADAYLDFVDKHIKENNFDKIANDLEELKRNGVTLEIWK